VKILIKLLIISEQQVDQNNFIRDISIIIRLTRIRLSLMVAFSAITGFCLTGSPPGMVLIYLFSGIFFLAAGASGFNQVQEFRHDALMKRTMRRPIPAGEISRPAASMISLLLIIGGTILLWHNGWLPMILGLLNIVFYNLIYTPLKTRSWLAIIPGAFVGAVPPLIGWTSAGHYIFHPNAVFIATFVFLWQIQHFWLIIIKYGKEYESAGFPSIRKSLNDREIKLVVFYWGVITSIFLMLFPLFKLNLSTILQVPLIAMNLFFIALFHRFLSADKRSGTFRNAFILLNAWAVTVFLLLIFNVWLAG
jgi:protoheme IX farnesyltransferase